MVRYLLALGIAFAGLLALTAPASASSREYVLIAPGGPAMVLGPQNAEQMTVTLANSPVLRVGRFSAIAAAPLGHDATEVPIGAPPADTIVHVRIEPADAGVPRVEVRDDYYDAAIVANRLDGIVIGILIGMMLVQIFGYMLARDASIPWYIALVGSLAYIMFASEGALPFINASNGQPAQVLINLVNAVAIIGFEVTYLRLWSGDRRLLFRMLTLLLPMMLLGIVIATTPALRDHANLYRAPLAALFSIVLIGVGVVRARSYPPAWYLVSAIALLSEATIYRAIRTLDPGYGTPLLDHWNFQISTAVDAVVFGLAVVARVRYSLRERRKLERDVRIATHDARHDPLTSLMNRRGLFDSVAQRDPRGTLFFIDLDGFKAVNDRLGHAAGDIVLREAGAVLRAIGGDRSTVARLGGDEFVVIVPPDDNRSPDTVAAKVVDEIEAIAPFASLPGEQFGASLGFVKLGELAFENALRLADQACYREKHRKHPVPR